MNSDSRDFIPRYISSVGAPVTQEDVDTYDRISQIHAREEEGRGQRLLRLIYGVALLVLLSLQIVAVTVFIFLLGFGKIDVDRWVTATFIGGTLGEVAGMTYLVVRHLFPVSDESSQNG